MSPKMWVVITGGILGIVAMRLVVGQLIVLVERYPALVDGAFVIIAWVGVKLCARLPARRGLRRTSRFRTGSRSASIVVIFVIAFVYARMQGPVDPGEVDTLAEQAEEILAGGGILASADGPVRLSERTGSASAGAAGRQRRLAPLAVPHVDDLHRLVHLQQLERVGVVVDVGDRLAGDLDDDVALHQAGLLGRAAADDAAEQQPFDLGRVVRNRAGGDAQAGDGSPRERRLIDLRELRRRRRRRRPLG